MTLLSVFLIFAIAVSIGRDVLNIRMLQEGMLEIPQHLQHVKGHKEAKGSTKRYKCNFKSFLE